MIGIIGGVGPYAGLDLQRKILEETGASRDQDHLPVLTWSAPGEVGDRTDYLLGATSINPGFALADQLTRLHGSGARIAAIACNSAHAPAIFDVVASRAAGLDPPLALLHMVREVASFLRRAHPGLRRVGVLSTTGARDAKVYPSVMEPLGFNVVVPDDALQHGSVHAAIYDPVQGIKATGGPSRWAREALMAAWAQLHAQGAEALILGCTELPLALPEVRLDGLPVIDPARVLARALVRAAREHLVSPWDRPVRRGRNGRARSGA